MATSIGEKIVREIPMLEGVTISESKAQKDEIIIQGNDIQNVSQSCASIHGACLVKNKGLFYFSSALLSSLTLTADFVFCTDRYPKVPRRSLRFREDHRG